MKIGIVTWYKNGNFGGTLQAFALQTVLQRQGYETEFVNYNEANKLTTKIKRILKNIFVRIKYPSSAISRKKIWKFVKKNMNESRFFNNYNKLKDYAKENYKVAICGSDQIWSNINEINEFYYLTFMEKSKRIAYAPSIGVNKIDKEKEKKFKEYINDIKYLSVRETYGRNIIKKITGNSAKVVLDPTLLLNSNEWRYFLKLPPPQNKSRYILCYFISYKKEYVDFAERLSKQTNLPIIYISSAKIKFGKPKQRSKCGIREFITLINEAEYVLTDSFHGLVFSINFNKKVAVFRRFNDNDIICQNSRIYSILEQLGIENFLLETTDDVKKIIDNEFNYIEINKKLNSLRIKSNNYLFESLNQVLSDD